jgi:hypothetical protein
MKTDPVKLKETFKITAGVRYLQVPNYLKHLFKPKMGKGSKKLTHGWEEI